MISKLSSLPQLKILRTGFILFVVAHLNLVMPISRSSNGGDICIMDNGIYMAHHSDNQKIHDHRGDTHHSAHNNKGIHKIKVDCNMDMSSSDIYFPGGEHPFTNNVIQTLMFESPYVETVSLLQTESIEGFTNLPYNPPKFIS